MRAELASAVFALYPNVVNIVADDAFDAEGNAVDYDMEAVVTKAETDAQAQEAAKQTAQDKLAKLGLTPEDLKALLG